LTDRVARNIETRAKSQSFRAVDDMGERLAVDVSQRWMEGARTHVSRSSITAGTQGALQRGATFSA